MNDTKIQWHSGFVSAMDLELKDNRDALLYEREYNLNKKPLEIDLLVVKKDANVQITNEIGRLFRGHNIMEYKSPEDHLDIDVLYKAIGYACLYKSYGKTVDERKADDITLSLLREAKPEKLFQDCKEHKMTITNPYQGIYYIKGMLFPSQIIVTGELDRKTHAWLTSLSGKMQEQDMEELLKSVNQLQGKYDRELADSILGISIRANQEIVKKLKGDDIMCEELLELMEPEILKIKEEVKAQAEKEGMERGFSQGLSQGLSQSALRMIEAGELPPEKIASYSGLALEEVLKMKRELQPI